MVCLILLAIQLVRVSFLQNTKDQNLSEQPPGIYAGNDGHVHLH